MMRATYGMLLVGLLLAGTMLVPYEFASRGLAPAGFSVAPFTPTYVLQVPPGKVLLDFPDKWNGATTVTLYDAKVWLPQTLGLNPGTIELRLPAGMTVYPGSRWLNLSVEVPGRPHGHQFSFEYVSADDRRGLRTIENRGTYSLPLEEPMNDWSADEHTRWQIRIFNHELENLEAHVRLTTARPSGPLPAHVFVPDRWAGQESRLVFEQRDALRQATLWRTAVPVEDKGPASSIQLRGVPGLELQELQVHMHYNSSTPTDFHYRPLLTWNSPRADGYGYDRNNIPPEAEQRGRSGHFMWRIAVDPDMYDNPLGTRSRWQIHVNWYGNSTDVQEYYMDGDFHLKVVAHRLPAPPLADRKA